MSETDLPTAWLREFERLAGRPLRVLHIGNIANNAYNNAKIQRDRGIEADVVSCHQYHIMSSPEWEDAEIVGNIGDTFFPDWWRVDLGEWRRPTWFVQGATYDCLAYLRAKNNDNDAERIVTRTRLLLANWYLVRYRQNIMDRAGPGASPLRGAYFTQTLNIAPEVAGYRSLSLRDRIRAHLSLDLPTLIGPRLMGVGDVAKFKRSMATANQGPIPSAPPPITGKSSDPEQSDATSSWQIRPMVSVALKIAAFATVFVLRHVGRWLRSRSLAWRSRAMDDAVAARAIAVREEYRRNFADTAPTEIAADIQVADKLSAAFADVLTHYDIVQGYATEGLIPLFAGVAKFTAYEHGTIRQIPFEDTTEGRLCKFTYKQAQTVFVTNTDVLPSIPRIGIDANRVVYLPHAFNDAKLRTFRDANPQLRPPQSSIVFFSPTRHHWHHGDGSWLKGNDVLLRAAGLLVREGLDFKLVLVEWGAELDKSKALIEAESIGHVVEWVPPMTKRALWRRYCEADAVVDQFTLPAIGGVGFECLALGRRLITRVDEPTMAHFFGVAPPILSAASIDEVAARMREVLADRDDRAGRGEASRSWIETYHSANRIVGLQLEAYARILSVPTRPPDISG